MHRFTKMNFDDEVARHFGFRHGSLASRLAREFRFYLDLKIERSLNIMFTLFGFAQVTFLRKTYEIKVV